MNDIYLDDLRNEIKLETAGSFDFEIESFARVFARRLEDAEQVFDLSVEALQCRGAYGKRLELLGYAEDMADKSIVLLAGRYFGTDETLTLSDATAALARATAFIESAADGWLADNLEVSSRESEYAEYFKRKIESGDISKIRAVLITDGVMSNRIKKIENGVIAGVKTTYEIWDQRRILEVAKPETRSEDVELDFTQWIENGLPCLIAGKAESSLPSYLAVLPARILADIFEEYGSLLLESNVRTFLSARGGVNRGIQETLRDAPDKFLAYNNGITATAVSLEMHEVGGGTFIKSLKGWQIVNGGQTTASISHFLRTGKGRTLDGVAVQMKLVVVDPLDASEVVHSVAKYANSQNRVSGADLFSTHDFHIRMEQISRRLRAPAKEGQQYRSGWYYERARGQWENDRTARGALTEQKKFELEYPKAHRITKTDWAKYAYCWGKKPHLVSKGAQSVFADYAVAVDKLWEANNSQFGDDYFRTNVGKAILYETLRVAVLRQAWYKESPGYLANIVAYAISRFALQVDKQFSGDRFDFERVWQQQAVGEEILLSLLEIGHLAQAHLTDSSRPQANVTQWAKQQACWEQFANKPIQLPQEIRSFLTAADDARTATREAKKERAIDTAYEQISRILNVAPAVWEQAAISGQMSPTEGNLVRRFGTSRGNVPSERQASTLLSMLDRMAGKGIVSRSSY